MRRFKCGVCGFIYDEAKEGTKWDDLPADWVCPVCGAPKSAFEEIASEAPVAAPSEAAAGSGSAAGRSVAAPAAAGMSAGELSVLCSNLALGCDKQQLLREKELFTKLADYFETGTAAGSGVDLHMLAGKLDADIAQNFPAAETAAASDRGAKRVLTWSKKVTVMLKSLLERCESEGEGFVSKTNVWVCDICGFIYVGDVPPDICPVCKVPSFKILKVERS